MNHFKTMKALREASLEEIEQIVSKQVASNIYQQLHPDKKL